MKRDTNQSRWHFVAAATTAFTGLEFGMFGSTRGLFDGLITASTEGLSALRGAATWLNSPPLTEAGLRGRVVVVDIWTYTCINWLRTLPYRRAWEQKYRENGLVVIGVHTPEFDFEHDPDNVRRAARDRNIVYPIAIDNEYAIWRGLDNHYWPALYIFDAAGDLRHRKFGEGEYAESESVIRRLLAGNGVRGINRDAVSIKGRGAEAPADWHNLATPETYLGHERAERFAMTPRVVPDAPHAYAAPTLLRSNEWALDGTWTVGRQAVRLGSPSGRILCRFHARDLHLVMGPAARGTTIRFRVGIDGQPPAAAHGLDVDEQGNGTVSEQRMYQLIRQAGGITDRRFEIEFLDAGVDAFVFTFG